AYFWLADMARRDTEYDVAVERYERFRNLYPEHVMAEWSLVYEGICHRDKGDTDAAIRTFQQFLEEYPESDDAEYCQRQIATLMEEREEN
ncbi:MAG TPA: tetratricopeptide repeat protein, partial [candidate division Zixibacteria bacterium]|nr:tetratricopeptide repeat protein [candidate division Zixibacteria bacterium]